MTTATTSENQEYLVYGLVAEEVKACLQAGREPDVAALIRDHPELESQIRQLLPTLMMVQQLGEAKDRARDVAACPGGQGYLPEYLGDFHILREIGRGGMGVVYEAQQVSLKRRVALKVLPFAAVMDPRQLQRFQNEAQAAASLHHTNIVPVHAVGSERGVHYFAMQFIDGRPLDAVIRDLRRQQHGQSTGPQPAEGAGDQPTAWYAAAPPATSATAETARPAQAVVSTEHSITSREFFHNVARLGIQAAEALDCAHHLGVVHRDIKPGNLMVEAGGHVWVTDFGLARVQADASITATGDLVGTLRYMSPEQALVKRVVIDHRTDIYSLGATLYELLTLRPAFPGKDRQEVLRQIAFDEPPLPRRLNRAVPAELEVVVLKALEKSPADRYATAQELADDLGRFLEDKPIRAKRPSLWQR
ncbi:MAG TPA: serine/threonine-protein kinase, partial [Bryobacteraceae bacterium]|nr:serine/threonine-protein kinase [Bryobacteraceae bacterium]